MHCADTSFLCALYRQQTNSEAAIVALEGIGAPVVISPIQAFEFPSVGSLPSVPALAGRRQGLSGDGRLADAGTA